MRASDVSQAQFVSPAGCLQCSVRVNSPGFESLVDRDAREKQAGAVFNANHEPTETLCFSNKAASPSPKNRPAASVTCVVLCLGANFAC